MSAGLKNRARRPGVVDARPDRRSRVAPSRRPAGNSADGSECGSGEVTLESKLLTAWAALAAGYPIECPVCSGPFTANRGCIRCGSTLS